MPKTKAPAYADESEVLLEKIEAVAAELRTLDAEIEEQRDELKAKKELRDERLCELRRLAAARDEDHPLFGDGVNEDAPGDEMDGRDED